MTKIIIKGNDCRITEELDTNHILALDKHLSFYVQGAEHTAAFRGFFNRSGDYVKWDGFQKLLTPSLHFAVGLLERVKEFYSAAGKELEIIDQRPPKSSGTPKDIIEKLKQIGINPYSYQLEVLDVIEKYDRGIIRSATGSGKTTITALITAKLGKKTNIYVVGKDLLYQFYDLYSKIFDEKIGLVGDGHCELHNINIISVWTAAQAVGVDKKNILLDGDDLKEKELSKNKYIDLLRVIKEAKVNMFDEAHFVACSSIQQIFKHSQSEHIYGLSGSPWRDDGADLLIESVLGRYIVNISASYLIERGYLAQPLIRFRVVPPLNYELPKVYTSVYKNYVVENETRNNLILEAAKTMVEKGYQTLVLFNSIKHGKILYELFQPHLKCAILNGKNTQEERSAIKKELEDKKINCILASRIYDIGVDIPSLSGLVLASSGKSTVRALRRIGRVIRYYQSKKNAVIVDFVDQAPFLLQHSKIRHKVYKSEEGFDVQWPKKKKT